MDAADISNYVNSLAISYQNFIVRYLRPFGKTPNVAIVLACVSPKYSFLHISNKELLEQKTGRNFERKLQEFMRTGKRIAYEEVAKIALTQQGETEFIPYKITPFNIDDFFFHPIIGIPKYIVENSNVNKKWNTSFFDSSVNYLSEIFPSLSKPGDYLLYPKSIFLRQCYESAARNYLAELSEKCCSTQSGRYLFYQLTDLAGMKYEKKASSGSIYLANDTTGLVDIVMFDEPVPLAETRRVRKLLETASGEYGLLCNGAKILCLGKINKKNPNLLIIKIGQNTWNLLNAEGHPLLCYDNATLYIQRGKYDEEKLLADLNIFTTSQNVQKIKRLIDTCANSHHGTTLVFTRYAQEETGDKRLGGDCFKISPVEMTPTNILDMTAIDGAIIMDEACVAHGFGVILDGKRVGKPDTSRGARYNSALRYLALHKERYNKKDGEQALVVIVSDDGTVDIHLGARPSDID